MKSRNVGTYSSSQLGYESSFASLHKTLTTLFRGFQESELSDLLERHERAELTNDFLILLELLNNQFKLRNSRMK